MLAITTNGARPVPVGPGIKGVPQDLRDLFTELVDTEVPMTESAAEKIMAYIGKNQETVLARIDGVKDQYYGLDKRVSAHETEVNKVASLDVRMDGLEARIAENTRTVDKQLTDIARDVAALKKAGEDAANDKKADRRTVKDSAIRMGLGALGVLLIAGASFTVARWTMPQPAPVVAIAPPEKQETSTAVDPTDQKLDVLIELLEKQNPAQTIKVPQRNKQRRAPGPPGPTLLQRNDHVWADRFLPLYGSARAPISPGERRF